MGTRRTTLLIDSDLLERVDRFVHRSRTTKTAVVSRALEAWLAAHDTTPGPGFIGVGRSQHGRLSLDGRSIVRRQAGRSRPGP
jgi:hypothetical protein